MLGRNSFVKVAKGVFQNIVAGQAFVPYQTEGVSADSQTCVEGISVYLFNSAFNHSAKDLARGNVEIGLYLVGNSFVGCRYVAQHLLVGLISHHFHFFAALLVCPGLVKGYLGAWRKLSDIAPSYYIYGNNEIEKYYDVCLSQEDLDKKFGFSDSDRDAKKLLEIKDELTKKLGQTGIKVLKNQHDTITVGSTKVDVYGVLTSNPSAFWSYAGESFDEYIYTNEKNLKIMAIHEPLLFEEYTPDFWGDVMLAGHHHGGMIKIPIIGPLYGHGLGLFPARGGHYIHGRYEVQGRPLIISSGLENKLITRINNQPEIVIVDINKF